MLPGSTAILQLPQHSAISKNHTDLQVQDISRERGRIFQHWLLVFAYDAHKNQEKQELLF